MKYPIRMLAVALLRMLGAASFGVALLLVVAAAAATAAGDAIAWAADYPGRLAVKLLSYGEPDLTARAKQ